MTKAITHFTGDYRFLSNFWYANVEYDGRLWPSVEHAYQAMKSSDRAYQDKFMYGTPGNAKRLGKNPPARRPDWDGVKLRIMETCVRSKFQITRSLGDELLDTGDAELVEGNHWGDVYWGVCRGVGENNLGKILMKVRAELAPGRYL